MSEAHLGGLGGGTIGIGNEARLAAVPDCTRFLFGFGLGGWARIIVGPNIVGTFKAFGVELLCAVAFCVT